MEEDLQKTSLRSAYLRQSSVQDQIRRLEAAVEEASESLNFETAHNPEILYAIDIVEDFIRSKKRVCYGGTAINAILPSSLQFYNSESDLPDYDFFSPSPQEDIAKLVQLLTEAGFREINQRVGVHEGTYKVLVNYIPIADITHMEKSTFKIISERAIRKDGVYYCDPDFLRMMMYLELSRPRGDVSRWAKVYERLLLLNHAFPMKNKCKQLPRAPDITSEIREVILNYLLEKNRTLIGAEVAALYMFSLNKRKYHDPSLQWFVHNGGAVVFLSSEILADSLELRNRLGKDVTQVEVVKGTKELVPDRVILRANKRIVAILVEEQACHSYNTIQLKNDKKIHIGSIDTMLQIYFALAIFTKDQVRLGYSIQCLCQRLVDVSIKLRNKKDSGIFPEFSITCSGYQKGLATLLRERGARILRERKKQKSTKKVGGRRLRTTTRKVFQH